MKSSISTLKLEAEDHYSIVIQHRKEIISNFSQKSLVYLTYRLNFIFQKQHYREDLQSYERNLNFLKTVLKRILYYDRSSYERTPYTKYSPSKFGLVVCFDEMTPDVLMMISSPKNFKKGSKSNV